MKEQGISLIESLMFDEHDLVKRAATECMCNMVLCEEVGGETENRKWLSGSRRSLSKM